MGTNKSIAFAAPYTSATFNNAQALNIGPNGVMSGMTVTTSGTVATIQPGSFIQNGIVVTVTLPISATIPATLVAPYSIVVSTSGSIQNPGEIITPTFAQRPEDISANSVIVADWDGAEWIQRPYLQVAQLVAASQNHAVEQEFVGINSGFDATLGVSTIDVTSGTLIDQQGSFFKKTLASSFALGASDIDGLYRTDELVFRRPDDDSNRPGNLQYIVGPTFNSSSTVQSFHNTQVGSNTNTNIAGKVVNVSSSNTSLFFYMSNDVLKMVTSPDLMSSFTPAVVLVASGVTAFDAVLNPSGNVDVVYTSGNDVYYAQFTTAGVVVYASMQIGTHAVPTSNPKLVTINSGASFFIHVVYEVAVSGSVHQLWYVRLSSADTIETSALLLVDLSAVVTNPSIDKDDTDSLLILAYENSTTGKAYLREYDASTATALAIPTQVGTTLELESDTFVISTSTVLSASGATKPKVVRASNKETYVFWLQDKGGGNYGVAVYNRNNINLVGHLAYIQDLVSFGENIADYDVSLDGLSNAHFSLSEAGSLWKSSLILETTALLGTPTAIDANTPTGISVNFNAKGSLVHFWSYVSGLNTTINFVKTSVGVFTNLRGFSPIHTDVPIARYRTPDGAYAAAGKVIDEHQAITRLYEFMNCAGAAGQVSWGITASNQLSFTTPITLNFFNRVSTYSIAGIPLGITIGNNQMAYVQIPDTDATAVLTLNVADFGSGVLDRHTRDTFMLFWNVGGVLYSRFAPFRLTSGEIINLGDQISVELQNWLGAPSLVPTTHAYNTTQTIVTNSDSHEAAIGKLDARGDVNIEVTLIDLVTTVLPSGPTATIDGVSVANGYRVLFTQSLLNQIYVVSGVGTSIVWTPASVFSSSPTPFAGAQVSVQQGTSYAATLWRYFSYGWRPLDYAASEIAPTGSVDSTTSTISFNDGTRVFTIAPVGDHFDFYVEGVLFRKNSPQTVTIPNTDGLYFIYFDNTGTLQFNTIEPSEATNAPISEVLWSVSDAKGDIVADERHGITMDWSTREYLHDIFGMRLESGFNITYTLGTDGSTDAQAEIALANGSLVDENLTFSVTNSASPVPPFEQTLTPIAKIPVFYLDSTGVWRKTTATNFPVKSGTSRITYNLFSGGNWTTPDATEGYFVPMFIIGTNNTLEPVAAILGQSQYSTLSAAQTGALYSNLTFGSLLTPEQKVLYRIIFQTSTTFTNTPHAMVAEVVDLRVVADSTIAATSVTEHNLLSGRDAAGAHPATAISVTTSSFTRVLNASDTDVQTSLNDIDGQVNKFFGQLLLTSTPAHTSRATITGADVTMQDGVVRSQIIKNLVMNFTGAQISFGAGDAGTIYASDGVTVIGSFTYPSIPVGQWQWFSVSLLANTIGSDNRISVTVNVIAASTNGASQSAAPRATFTSSGFSLGEVAVQSTGVGTINPIGQSNVVQLGIGSGSGSGGTGNVTDIQARAEMKLLDSRYQLATIDDFLTNGTSLTSSATATFDVANSRYDFTAAAQQLVSVNLFDANEFLTQGVDCSEAEVDLYYLLGNVDKTPTVDVSRDGGNNYFPVTVSRVGTTDQFTGRVVFGTEATYTTLASQALDGAGIQLNATTVQSLSQMFTVANAATVVSFQLTFGKSGTNITGLVYVQIVKDSTGSPGTPSSSPSDVLTSITNQATNLTTLTTFSATATLPAGNYHLVVSTDSTYKTAYNASTNAVAVDVHAPGSAPFANQYNGTTWSSTGDNFTYVVTGRVLDLRLKVIASATTNWDVNTLAVLNGFAVSYNPSISQIASATAALEVQQVNGTSNVSTFTLGNFLPDPSYMRVYVVETGQVFRFGAYSLNGYQVIFPANTFSTPGQTYTIYFDQTLGGGFDNTDVNAALLAANHLGSTSANIDRSSNGRGIILRRPDGTLREITIDNSDNIAVYSVP